MGIERRIYFQKELHSLISEIKLREIQTIIGRTQKPAGNFTATRTRIIQNRNKRFGGYAYAGQGENETGFAIFKANEGKGKRGVCGQVEGEVVSHEHG
jgi:hypothetical protein